MCSEEDKKQEESLVVGSPYAIVKPIAMMIEFIATFIALTAVFGVVAHIAFAYRASHHDIWIFQELPLPP